LTEDELLSAIIGPGCNNLCDLYGWQSFHVRPARTENGYRSAVQGSGVGFPDLVLVSLTPRPRKNLLLYRELKSDIGKLSDDQWIWFDLLKSAGQDVAIWRPMDWPLILDKMRPCRS
jgi:hypothetical protein